MNESNKSSPLKGDFIDLEKNQYKKNNKIKKYIIITLFILTIPIFVVVYLKNYDVKSFLSQKSNNDKSSLTLNRSEETTEIEKKTNSFDEQFIFLNENIDLLKQEIFENSRSLSKANKKISNLKQQLNDYEARQVVNAEFYYTEKYIILNYLISLKNKFERRISFSKELDNLISLFSNKPKVKSVIINLQSLDISRISKIKNLLDRLNEKINFYETDIDRFISTNFSDNSRDYIDMFNSKENFVKYIKEIFNSTYKLTRVNDYAEKNNEIPYQNYNFRKILEKAKEYLIIGNLKGAIEIVQLSNFDDNEIDIWIKDASNLDSAQEQLRLLEFFLLESIGEDSD